MFTAAHLCELRELMHRRPLLRLRPACLSGKEGYADAVTAHTALAKVRERRGPGRANERRTYRCDLCGEWHLTSSTEYRRRA